MSSIDSQFTEQASFAGGCFWCVQGPFDAEPGTTDVEVGYLGGDEANASYYTVASGGTQHREGIHMKFDPSVVEYKTLVETFFRQIDPTDAGGQFADRGFHYTTAIYYHSDEQRNIAQAVIDDINASGKFSAPVATVLEPFTTFFAAEDEHQEYYKKNPLRYKMYKRGSGRADYITENWSWPVIFHCPPLL